MNLATALPILLAAIAVIAWGAVVAVRRRGRAATAATAGSADLAITAFVERSLDLESLSDVLAAGGEAARAAFAAVTVVAFEPGAREAQWDAANPGVQALEPVPDADRGVFAWFKHNSGVVLLAEIGDARYGAMRVPLGNLARRYSIDAIVPLVDRGQTIGALGLGLPRRPTRDERELYDVFRQEVTAAAANVRLHREAAHKLTLEKEVDLAGAVQLALVPPVSEGRAGKLVWTGHYRPAGQVGSDFWSAYDLGNERVLIVIGDVVGTGLAGSMASAVAKSCCDALHAAGAAGDAGNVLIALNRALFRPQRPIHMTCFAAVFDARAHSVSYANAGHVLPYHWSPRGLGVLGGSGPMLGDGPDARYSPTVRPIEPGDVFLLFTDGISEAMNAQRAPFGERRLQRAIARATGGVGPRATKEAILTSVEEFRAGTTPHDDEALVVVRVD
jgi:serine phosphatase RsbU (regulator of sigma subunit)